MKKTILILILFAAILSCNSNTTPMENDKLKLRLLISQVGVVGYGEVYACEVVEVLQGKTQEKNLSLTILDYENIVDLKLLPIEVIVDFQKNKLDEPYAIMPITGFVDSKKTSWIITRMENVEK